MLPGGVGRVVGGDPDGADGGYGESQETSDHAASPLGAAVCGMVSGAKKRLTGSRERRVAGGRFLPAGDGSVDGGEPARPVEIGGIPAVHIPRTRVTDNLAVQGAVELVVPKPVPELCPGVQQHVMGNLDAILAEDEQAPGAEDVDDRIDVGGRLGSHRAQIGLAAPAPRELAIRRDDGELGEYQTRRVPLVAGQGVVGGPGAAVDRVRDSARTPVAAQGQLGALAVPPGGRHRLGHQRQHATAQAVGRPFAQLGNDRLDQSGLHGEAGFSSGPGYREPQFGLTHRPDREWPGVQGSPQWRVSDDPAEEIRAHRRYHQRLREFLRTDRYRGRGVQGRDERLPLRLAAVGVRAGGEELLELVDDQDEAWWRIGGGMGLRARSWVRAATGGRSDCMPDQNRRLIWCRRQRPIYRNRIRARDVG